jgi:hypothetical protein
VSWRERDARNAVSFRERNDVASEGARFRIVHAA